MPSQQLHLRFDDDDDDDTGGGDHRSGEGDAGTTRLGRTMRKALVRILFLGVCAYGLFSAVSDYFAVGRVRSYHPSSEVHLKTVHSEKTTTTTTTRLRFTQFWSTGHVGTRYIAGLLAAPDYFEETEEGQSPRLVWGEYELPSMSVELEASPELRGMSLRTFKNMMISWDAPGNREGSSLFQKHVRYDDDHWYGGVKIKEWNERGNRWILRGYQENERLLALRSVAERYRDSNGTPRVTHFVKVGHTSVFFDLEDYYDVYSGSKATWTDPELTVEIDMDFVRLRRRRVDVAMSFAANWTRADPVETGNQIRNICTHPAMKTATLRLASVDDGIIPDDLWESWTIFQQYLWFADEIEARWMIFRNRHPNVPVFDLGYVDGSLPDKALDDLAVDFLGYPEPITPYLTEIERKSHRVEKTKGESSVAAPPHDLTEEEQIRQAIEYAKEAPWCLQYEGSTVTIDDLDPLLTRQLDCSPEA